MTKAEEMRQGLSRDQLMLLETQVLPTAHRWVATYHPRSNLYQHAMQTLAYWGER